MTSPMFACSECGIAYFYTAKSLQSHFRECRSVNELQKKVASLQEEMVEQRLLLGNVSTSVQTALNNLSSFQETCTTAIHNLTTAFETFAKHQMTTCAPAKRRRRKTKNNNQEYGDDDDITTGEGSIVTSSYSKLSLTPEMQLLQSVAYFRKRKIELPVCLEKVEEVEQLLNELFPAPSITFVEFQEVVREDVVLIRSLFSEFMDLLDQHRNKNRFSSNPTDERTEEEDERSNNNHSLEQFGIQASDVTSSLDAAGGAHQLLLTKFLQFFHNGFANYRMQFPMLIIHLGRKKILKFTERLFGNREAATETTNEPKRTLKKRKMEEWIESFSQKNNEAEKNHDEDEDYEEEEQEEGDENGLKEEPTTQPEFVYQDLDNISCFPFFVFVDKETGWKIMKYTDHVYPLFLLIQSTILYRGMTDSHAMMSQEENKISEVVSSLGDRKKDKDRRLMITRKLEASYEEQSQMVSKLSCTVVDFISKFRQKYFEEFLQVLYDSYSAEPTQIARFVHAAETEHVDQHILHEELDEQSEHALSRDVSKHGSPPVSLGSRSSTRSNRSSVGSVSSRKVIEKKITKKVYVYNGEEDELSIDDYC